MLGPTVLILSILANAGASILVKLGMTGGPQPSPPSALLLNPYVWLGIILYGIAFLTYAYSLRLFPLNLAHPTLTAGAIAMVSISSVIVFRESLPLSAILGLALIIAGVILLCLRPF